jgi:hypothetical protein
MVCVARDKLSGSHSPIDHNKNKQFEGDRVKRKAEEYPGSGDHKLELANEDINFSDSRVKERIQKL